MQFLIAIDQLINTLVWAKHEGFGFADEAISARCFRLRYSPRWERAEFWIDWLFYLLTGEWKHCENAYRAECERRQYPPSYCED